MATEPLDLDAIVKEWLLPCGHCDAGLPMACTCPPVGEDPRPTISLLVREIQRVRDEIATELGAVGLPSSGDPVENVLLLITELYRGDEDKVRAAIAAQEASK